MKFSTMLKAAVLTILVFTGASVGSYNAAFSQGLAGGAFSGFNSDSGEPIQIEADRLEVVDKKSQATFEGNVKVVQGTTVLTTRKLRVFYVQKKNGKSEKKAQNSEIERMELSGGVHVRSDDNVATSDSGTYNMKTQDVVLIGDVTLSQGDNIAKGCVFKANLGTGIAHLESQDCPGKSKGTGRIQMLLSPGSKKTP